MSTHPELPERDRRILGVLVQRYIDDGEPISSLWLASRGFGVSSATLRNILARLEEQGFVRQPHTSAGRVPTDRGYRCYVDQLLAERADRRARRLRSKPGCGWREPSRICCPTRPRKCPGRPSS